MSFPKGEIAYGYLFLIEMGLISKFWLISFEQELTLEVFMERLSWTADPVSTLFRLHLAIEVMDLSN